MYAVPQAELELHLRDIVYSYRDGKPPLGAIKWGQKEIRYRHVGLGYGNNLEIEQATKNIFDQISEATGISIIDVTGSGDELGVVDMLIYHHEGELSMDAEIRTLFEAFLKYDLDTFDLSSFRRVVKNNCFLAARMLPVEEKLKKQNNEYLDVFRDQRWRNLILVGWEDFDAPGENQINCVVREAFRGMGFGGRAKNFPSVLDGHTALSLSDYDKSALAFLYQEKVLLDSSPSELFSHFETK